MFRTGIQAGPLIRFVARFNFVHDRGVAGNESAAELFDEPRVHELFGVAGDGNDDRWLAQRDRATERGVATADYVRIRLHPQLVFDNQPAVDADVALGLVRPPDDVAMKADARPDEGTSRV